eukprot:gene10107-7204_t
MDLKPELAKTIRRLSTQKNFDVLKNKLRSWLVTREVTVADLIRHCREKTISIPAVVLNKLGILFGSGKEGIVEDSDTAFWFYLAAADFGFGPANGNVAQYYYDGRAPGGRNIELAFQYCRKALELGTDKFMLMSEILHEREDYPETVRYLRKIIENRHSDNRRRVDARKLEIECLQKQLLKIFAKLAAYQDQQQQQTSDYPAGFGAAAAAASAPATMKRPLRLALQISTARINGAGNANYGSSSVTPPPKSPMSLSLESSMRKLAAVPFLPPPIPMRPLTPTAGGGGGGGGTPTQSASSHYDKVHASHYNPHRRGLQTHTSHFASPQPAPLRPYQSTYQHRLPGWFYVSDDLEGFDYNACATLTARAEVIELEALAIKSAYETAEQHVASARRHKFSEEIIQMLVKNKLHEFQEIYQALEENKNLLLATWNAYVDTTEHTLRRQVLTEKKFFQPSRMTNPLCLHLAQELFKRRLYNHPAYLDADWNVFTKADEALNEPLLLLNHSPFPYRIASARTLVTAERALLETAMTTYGVSNSYQFTQQTGWTGRLNLHVFDPTHRDAPPSQGQQQSAQQSGDGGNTESKGGDGGAAAGGNGGASGNAAGNAKKSGGKVGNSRDEDADGHHGGGGGLATQPHHHAKHHSMTHLRTQIREQLLAEPTFTETVVIGSTTMRIAHKTHPLLTTHHLQLALDSNRQQQAVLIAQQGLSAATVSASLQAAQHQASSVSHHHHRRAGGHHSGGGGHHHAPSVGIGGHGSHPNTQLQQLVQQEHLLEAALHHIRGDDYYAMEELGHSDEVLSFLHHLTLTDLDPHFVDNERKVAEIMLRFTHDGTPIDVKELQLINEDATERDAQALTRICFHFFVKRIVPWVLSFPDWSPEGLPGGLATAAAAASSGGVGGVGGSAAAQPTSGLMGHSGGYRKLYELPLATGQARAMQLVRHGLLTFHELFAWDGEYGIFHCGVHREVVSAPVGTSSAGTASLPANVTDAGAAGGGGGVGETSGSKSRSASPLRSATGPAAASAASAAAASAKQELAAAAAASEALLPEHPHAVIQTRYHDYAQMRRQLANINALYQRAVLEVTPTNFLSTMQFWKAHKEGVTLSANATADAHWEHAQYGAEDRELDFLVSKLRI